MSDTIAILKATIFDPPYNTMLIKEVVVEMAKPTKKRIRVLSPTEFLLWMSAKDRYGKTLAASKLTTPVRSIAWAIIELVECGLDLRNAIQMELCTTLVTENVWLQVDLDDLLSLVNETITVAQDLGIDELVKEGHVQEARS